MPMGGGRSRRALMRQAPRLTFSGSPLDDYSVLVLLGRAFLQRRQLLPDGGAHVELRIGMLEVLRGLAVLNEVGGLFEGLLERGGRGDRVLEKRLAEVREVAVVGAAEGAVLRIGGGRNECRVGFERLEKHAGIAGGHNEYAPLYAGLVERLAQF